MNICFPIGFQGRVRYSRTKKGETGKRDFTVTGRKRGLTLHPIITMGSQKIANAYMRIDSHMLVIVEIFPICIGVVRLQNISACRPLPAPVLSWHRTEAKLLLC